MPIEILNIITPVFLVIITGFLFRRFTNMFRPEASEVLVKFAFYIAVPALLLLVLTTTPIEQILNWQYIALYGGSTLLFFIGVTTVLTLVRKRPLNESVIVGSLSSLTNMGFVGLPLMLALFGHKTVAPSTLAILLLVIVFYPLMIILLEFSVNDHVTIAHKFKTTLINTLKNPVILPAIIGLILSAMEFKFPALVQNYFKVLENALTPCALFAIGLGIEVDKVKHYFKDVIGIAILKLVIMPALVLWIAVTCDVSPFITLVTVIAVAIPPAKSIYIIAGQYKAIQDETAAAISFCTLLSIVTMFAWIILLAKLYPTLFLAHT